MARASRGNCRRSPPTFSIRKKAIAIYTLDEYVAAGSMTACQCTNAVINDMVACDPGERVFIIEDTGEIQCAENFVQYHTSFDVSMTALLKAALRMRPDRILVGEMRGPEALDLLDAWNTGHEGGAATLHANNPAAGLVRLKSLISSNPSAPADIEPLIGEVVHIVVHIARTPAGRRLHWRFAAL